MHILRIGTLFPRCNLETKRIRRESGGTPLGAVGADYRPHITLGMTAGPVLPDLSSVPVGEFTVELAFGELGPYGTFPGLLRT